MSRVTSPQRYAIFGGGSVRVALQHMHRVVQSSTPEELAVAFVARAAHGSELAAQWVNDALAGSSEKLLQQAIDAAPTFDLRMHPKLEDGRVHFVPTYVDRDVQIREAARRVGWTEEEAERVAKAGRYALAFLRI